MRPFVAALCALLALGLAGCTSDSAPPPPGEAKVDVDTPALRDLRSAAGVADCAPGSAAAVDGGLPDVSLPCLGGGPDVDLAGLRGPMVVNLWASWCGPCREELPRYQAFHEQYGDRVAVLGIDYNDVQPAAALELARDSGVTYPLLADPQSALSARGPFPALRGLPFVAFVDADGTVVHQEFVEITSEKQLTDLAEKYLGLSL